MTCKCHDTDVYHVCYVYIISAISFSGKWDILHPGNNRDEKWDVLGNTGLLASLVDGDVDGCPLCYQAQKLLTCL